MTTNSIFTKLSCTRNGRPFWVLVFINHSHCPPNFSNGSELLLFSFIRYLWSAHFHLNIILQLMVHTNSHLRFDVHLDLLAITYQTMSSKTGPSSNTSVVIISSVVELLGLGQEVTAREYCYK